MLSKLSEKIENNQIEEASAIIEEIGLSKNSNAVPLLIAHLMSTDNKLLRNQIAIALSDIGDSSAVEPIIALLKDPKTLGNRGSLLYALEPFDCTKYIDLLVDMVCHGNFEVREKSITLLEKITSDIPSGKLINCLKMIKHEIDELEYKADRLYKTQDILYKISHK